MFGPKYPVSIIWEPRSYDGRPAEFICFEPMTGVTDAVNLHHEGKYPDLQTVAPAGTWSESFWIKPTGF
jgi:aldose 1-epimerase